MEKVNDPLAVQAFATFLFTLVPFPVHNKVRGLESEVILRPIGPACSTFYMSDHLPTRAKWLAKCDLPHPECIFEVSPPLLGDEFDGRKLSQR